MSTLMSHFTDAWFSIFQIRKKSPGVQSSIQISMITLSTQFGQSLVSALKSSYCIKTRDNGETSFSDMTTMLITGGKNKRSWKTGVSKRLW